MYGASHYGITFADGANYLREQNQLEETSDDPQLTFRSGRKDEAPGGFRGRGSILYAMRILKLQRFYEEHAICATYCDQADADPDYCDDLDALDWDDDDDDDDRPAEWWEDNGDEEIPF